MRTFQNLCTLVLFALALVCVLMALAYLPVDTGFLPAWTNDLLGEFPPLHSPGGTLVCVGVIGGIVLTAGSMMAVPAVTDRKLRAHAG